VHAQGHTFQQAWCSGKKHTQKKREKKRGKERQIGVHNSETPSFDKMNLTVLCKKQKTSSAMCVAPNRNLLPTLAVVMSTSRCPELVVCHNLHVLLGSLAVVTSRLDWAVPPLARWSQAVATSRCLGLGECHHLHVGWIGCLLAHNANDKLPHLHESIGRRWQVVLDRIVQSSKIVARYSGVHVVLLIRKQYAAVVEE
jgi:hypothetical protein